MIKLDMTGKPCPMPVVEARKALAKDGGVTVTVDNVTATQNLEKMALGLGYQYELTNRADGFYDVYIGGNQDAAKTAAAAAVSAETSARPGSVVVIGQNAMGHGDPELGCILIKGFLYALSEVEPTPECVIFLNSGVLLAEEGQNTAPDIKALEDKGVEVLACGTCCNFYGITERLGAGIITDMYGIAKRMASAGGVVNI